MQTFEERSEVVSEHGENSVGSSRSLNESYYTKRDKPKAPTTQKCNNNLICDKEDRCCIEDTIYTPIDPNFRPLIRWLLNRLYFCFQTSNFNPNLANEVEYFLMECSNEDSSAFPMTIVHLLRDCRLYNFLNFFELEGDSFAFPESFTDPCTPELTFFETIIAKGLKQVKDTKSSILCSTPFCERIHLNIIVAFVQNSAVDRDTEPIVEYLHHQFLFDKSALYPYDLGDALLLWINLCLGVAKDLKINESNIEEIEDLDRDLDDGYLLMMIAECYFCYTPLKKLVKINKLEAFQRFESIISLIQSECFIPWLPVDFKMATTGRASLSLKLSLLASLLDYVRENNLPFPSINESASKHDSKVIVKERIEDMSISQIESLELKGVSLPFPSSIEADITGPLERSLILLQGRKSHRQEIPLDAKAYYVLPPILPSSIETIDDDDDSSSSTFAFLDLYSPENMKNEGDRANSYENLVSEKCELNSSMPSLSTRSSSASLIMRQKELFDCIPLMTNSSSGLSWIESGNSPKKNIATSVRSDLYVKRKAHVILQRQLLADKKDLRSGRTIVKEILKIPTPPNIKKLSRPFLPPKSNKSLIRNALNISLAGSLNKIIKEDVLQDLEESSACHFILLFRDANNFSFRGLYFWDPVLDQALKLYAGLPGPIEIMSRGVREFYKYDSGARTFRVIPTVTFGWTVDAVAYTF